MMFEKSMVPAFKYLCLTVKHKWFVFLAGLKIGVPIYLLIIHDWSKFMPCEIFGYGRQFFGDQGDPIGFARAWNHHQNVNPHHWEYWVMVSGHNRGNMPDGSPLPMPEKYIREMLADWLGASRAYEGRWPDPKKAWPWFQQNFFKIKLHPHTSKTVLEILALQGFDTLDQIF